MITTRRALQLAKNPREVRRLLTLRCAHCGHKFRWMNDSRHATGNRDGLVYHRPCIGYLTWKRKAEDRLAVLALTMDISGLTDRDIQGAAELRAEARDERVSASNRAFSVFYDLSKESL